MTRTLAGNAFRSVSSAVALLSATALPGAFVKPDSDASLHLRGGVTVLVSAWTLIRGALTLDARIFLPIVSRPPEHG